MSLYTVEDIMKALTTFGLDHFAKGQYGKIGSKIAMSHKAQNVQDTLVDFSPIPAFSEAQGSTIKITDMRTYSKSVVHKLYESAFAIDQKVLKFGSLINIQNKLAQYPDVLMASEDALITAIYNAPTTYKAFDGVAMCATTHKLGANTIDNIDTSASLTTTNFATAVAAFQAFKNESDVLIHPNLFSKDTLILMVPSALEATAKAIVSTPFNSAGASNVWFEKAELLVNPYLSSATTWFLIAKDNPSSMPVVLSHLEELTVGYLDDTFKNRRHLYKGEYMAVADVAAYWNVYCCQA